MSSTVNANKPIGVHRIPLLFIGSQLESNEIQVDDLPAKFQQAVTGETDVSNRDVPSNPQTLKEALEGPERSIILGVLNGNNWNRNETAETLGINRTTLYKKMKKLGLEESRVVSCP